MRMIPIALLAACSARPTRAPADALLAPGAITYVGQQFDGSLRTPSLSSDNGVRAAGDALVIHVFDLRPDAPAQTFTLTAPGWQFQPLVATSSAALFGAIAPQTDISFTATSSSPTAEVNVDIDEFSRVGGGLGIGAASAVECACGGSCATNLVTARDDVAVWAAVAPGDMAMPGPGFTAGEPFGGARREYEITTDPAGTTEVASMTTSSTTSSACALLAVMIEPR